MPPHAASADQVWDASTTAETAESGDDKDQDDTQAQQQQRRLRPPGRSVSFVEQVTFREIEPLTELSEEEIRSVWYDDDEYTRIKKEVTSTVKKKNNGDDILEEEGYCMRGLEGRTKFGAKRRKNNKAAALDAVWTAQVSLWKKKIDNPAAIAQAYKPHSTNAKYPAIQTGHSDEMFVRKFISSSE